MPRQSRPPVPVQQENLFPGLHPGGLAGHYSWGEDFANAREVRNFFGSAVVSQADRRYGKEGLSDEDLCRLEESDFKYKERMIE